MNKAGFGPAVMRLHIAARVRKSRFSQVYDGAIGHNARRLFAGVRHGSRYNTAFFLARFLLFYVGFDYQTTLEIMENWNTTNKPPMDPRELAYTFLVVCMLSLNSRDIRTVCYIPVFYLKFLRGFANPDR